MQWPKFKKLIKETLATIFYYTGAFALYRKYRERFGKRSNLIVLRFHRILNGEKKDITGISVSKEMFEQLIMFLKEQFDIVSTESAVDALRRGRRFAKLTLAITLDDGYKDNYLYAYPVLKKYGVPATIFLTANPIGKENGFWWDNDELARGCLCREDISILDWQDISHMDNGLISFGSHTLSHPFLTRLSHGEAEKEIIDSKKVLEDGLKKQIKFFTYPHGDYNSIIKKSVKNARYEAAFTSKDTRGIKDLYAIGRKGLSQEVISGIGGRFSKPLTMFALLKNLR